MREIDNSKTVVRYAGAALMAIVGVVLLIGIFFAYQAYQGVKASIETGTALVTEGAEVLDGATALVGEATDGLTEAAGAATDGLAEAADAATAAATEGLQGAAEAAGQATENLTGEGAALVEGASSALKGWLGSEEEPTP